MDPKMISSFLISVTLVAFTSTAVAAATLDISQVLKQFPDFANFNDLLTETGLDAEIDAQDTVTVLVVDNEALDVVSGRPVDIVKRILSVHVVLDYYDATKLKELSQKNSIVTTLYQSSGVATGQTGFLNVTDDDSGTVTFASAASATGLGASLVKEVITKPYSLSVLQISDVILPPGIDNPAPPTSAAPPPITNASASAIPKASAPAASNASRTANATAVAKPPATAAAPATTKSETKPPTSASSMAQAALKGAAKPPVSATSPPPASAATPAPKAATTSPPPASAATPSASSAPVATPPTKGSSGSELAPSIDASVPATGPSSDAGAPSDASGGVETPSAAPGPSSVIGSSPATSPSPSEPEDSAAGKMSIRALFLVAAAAAVFGAL